MNLLATIIKNIQKFIKLNLLQKCLIAEIFTRKGYEIKVVEQPINHAITVRKGPAPQSHQENTYECEECYMILPTFEIFETHMNRFFFLIE